MSDDWNNDDDQLGNQNSGGSLRAQLEKALADNKALKDETASLKGQVTERNAADVLKDKGFKNPTAVGKFAIADGVDFADSKAVDKWLADNGDDFAKSESTQSQENPEGDQPGGEPNPTPPAGMESTYDAMGRIQSAASAGVVNRYKAAESALTETASKAEVLKAFAGL